MEARFWSTVENQNVRQYLHAATGIQFDFILPTRQVLNDLDYPTDFPNGDIGPYEVTQTTKMLRVGVNRSQIDAPVMKVGTSIYIRIYQGDYLGNGSHQCPVRNFHQCVLRDLLRFYNCVSGKRLLESINTHGESNDKYVYVSWCNGFTERPEADWLGSQPGKLDGATPGTPVSAKVQYNPLMFGVANVRGTSDRDEALKVGKWGHPAQKPPDVTLFHELVHADDMIRGIFDLKLVPRGRGHEAKISELRCVGLDRFSNPSIYSENSYRADHQFALRTFYKDKAEKDAFNGTPDRGLTDLFTFLDHTLMTMEEFRRQTSHRGARNKIREVETALDTYHREYSWQADPHQRLAGLNLLRKSCTDYSAKQKAKRDVSGLVTQIDLSAEALIDASTAGPSTLATFRSLRQFRGHSEENFHNNEALGKELNRLIIAMKTKLNGWQTGELQAQMTTTLKNEDIATLQQWSQSVEVNQALRQVLTELVAVANQQDVEFTDTIAGSSAGPKNTGGYRVTYGAYNQNDIRLATLVHELTHVATHKKWANTPIMFSYPANTNRQAVENLLDTRTASIKQLIDLARHEDTGFDDYQKHWLIDDKLTYAIKNDVSVSPNSLIPIKRTNASAAIHMEIFETAPAGISQVLWEFDTVLNQIMMYMHCWAIPEDNAFYTALRLMVQAQYDARTAV